MILFFGQTAQTVELEVIERQIQEGLGENTINDGTVANMLKRKRKEAGEGHLVLEQDENTVSNDIPNRIE